MFDEWREQRELRRRIALLKKEEANTPKEMWSKLTLEIVDSNRQLAELETDRLMRKARRLGIEIPEKESWWWDDLDYSGPDDYRYYLTDIGKAGVTRLIREEKRKSVEWWVKIITPILSAILALLGVIVALVSVSRK